MSETDTTTTPNCPYCGNGLTETEAAYFHGDCCERCFFGPAEEAKQDER